MSERITAMAVEEQEFTRKVRGYDPAEIRKDSMGHWIQFDQHGRETNYGWEIDHIHPRAKGGRTEIDNLQPLWWENNRRKGDSCE